MKDNGIKICTWPKGTTPPISSSTPAATKAKKKKRNKGKKRAKGKPSSELAPIEGGSQSLVQKPKNPDSPAGAVPESKKKVKNRKRKRPSKKGDGKSDKTTEDNEGTPDAEKKNKRKKMKKAEYKALKDKIKNKKKQKIDGEGLPNAPEVDKVTEKPAQETELKYDAGSAEKKNQKKNKKKKRKMERAEDKTASNSAEPPVKAPKLETAKIDLSFLGDLKRRDQCLVKVKPGERWHESIKTETPSMTAADGATVLPEDISRVSRYAESLYENELKVHQVWPLAKILFCWLFVKIIWYFSGYL